MYAVRSGHFKDESRMLKLLNVSLSNLLIQRFHRFNKRSTNVLSIVVKYTLKHIWSHRIFTNLIWALAVVWVHFSLIILIYALLRSYIPTHLFTNLSLSLISQYGYHLTFSRSSHIYLPIYVWVYFANIRLQIIEVITRYTASGSKIRNILV